MSTKPQPRAVFLVGFMGAGKSSVGQALARRLGWRFLDLDEQVEAREQRSIAEIFAQSGEAAFRQAETATLARLLASLDHSGPVVVALGGGASAQQENRRLLAESEQPQVFLDAPFEVLRERCEAMPGVRPLWQDEARTRALYQSRRPHYLRAGLPVDTTSKTPEQVAAEIERALGLQKPTGD